MHIKLCLELLHLGEAETYQKLLQLSLSCSRQTQPKREAWCNIIYTHIILPFILYLCYLSQLSWVKPSKIPCNDPPTWPLPPFRLHHQPQPCLLLCCTFPFIITSIQSSREVLPEGLGSRAEEPELSWHGENQHQGCSEPLGIIIKFH